MPIGDDIPTPEPEPKVASAAADTLITHLARRPGRVWNQLEPIASIPDGETRADALVMCLIASALLRLLDTGDVGVDPTVLEAMFPMELWRTVWNHMA